jgi:hypothetical protein
LGDSSSIGGWGGLAPAGVESLTNLVLKYNSNSVYKA